MSVAVSGAGWHGNPRHSCRHRPRLCCYHPGNQEYHHRSPSNVEHWRRHAVGGRPHPHDRLEARGAYVVHCMRRSDLVAPTLHTPTCLTLSPSVYLATCLSVGLSLLFLHILKQCFSDSSL